MKRHFIIKKHHKAATALALAVLLSAAVICAVLYGAYMKFPYDRVTDKGIPKEFFCGGGENRIDFQTDGNCAAYAAAYVLRSLGEQADGEEIAPEIKRIFGFVPAGSIVRVFEKRGFSAKAYRGDTDALKRRLSGGVPVIVFVSIPNDTHYAVAVGYDAQYFYLVDSLPENKNADDIRYNRKLTVGEFEKIRKTDTILPDNIYIVVDRADGGTASDNPEFAEELND